MVKIIKLLFLWFLLMFTSILGYGPGFGSETLEFTDPAKVTDPYGSGATTLLIMTATTNSHKPI
jgi:hypothetical protein